MLKEGRERGSAPQQQTIRTITISIGSEVESEKDQRDCLIQHKRPSITAMRANLSEIDSGSAHLSLTTLCLSDLLIVSDDAQAH